MEIYWLKKKTLPAEVLTLKEVARLILSSKQYKHFRRHVLVINPKKHHGYGCYHPSNWKFGAKAIILGLVKFGEWKWNTEKQCNVFTREPQGSLIDETSISVFIHELGHMVQHHNRNIVLKSRHHNRTFYRLLDRLKKNYETKAKPKLPEIITAAQAKQNERLNIQAASAQQKLEIKTRGNTTEGKLEKTRKLIKNWETKRKRAETYLKKLRRREKIYVRMRDKLNKNLPPCGTQTPCPDMHQQ